MNPQTGKAHGRAARRNGSKAHGRAARGDDGDDKTIDKGGGGIDGTDGFELPQLNDQRNTLRCAVGTCAADYSRVWHHADDRRQDPRRVCGRCAQRWPDITAHYPAKQQVFDDATRSRRACRKFCGKCTSSSSSTSGNANDRRSVAGMRHPPSRRPSVLV